jgi:hypothetical protein
MLEKHILKTLFNNYFSIDPIAIIRAIMERITWTTIAIES